MVVTAPLELLRLLRAADTSHREAAWEELIAKHSRMLIAVARSLGTDHDGVMDRYTYVLGKLRESDFRRLRMFQGDRGAAFSTWLAAIARNLCLDYHRTQFGRPRPEHTSGMASVVAAARRALKETQFDSDAVDPDVIVDNSALPDSFITSGFRDQCLRDVVAELTPRDRLLLTLRFRDDLSASEIAKLIGFATPFHVYRSLRKVLNALRAGLEARGIEDVEG